MRHCNVEFDLLSMPFDDPSSRLTPLQNVVRLVLFIFGFATYTRFEPFSAWTQAIVVQLKESLELTDLSAVQPSDLLLWAEFFGALVSRRTNERPWFIARLARTVSQLGLESAEDMQAVLLRFFYLGSLSQGSLLEIWDQVTLKQDAHPEISRRAPQHQVFRLNEQSPSKAVFAEAECWLRAHTL